MLKRKGSYAKQLLHGRAGQVPRQSGVESENGGGVVDLSVTVLPLLQATTVLTCYGVRCSTALLALLDKRTSSLPA